MGPNQIYRSDFVPIKGEAVPIEDESVEEDVIPKKQDTENHSTPRTARGKNGKGESRNMAARQSLDNAEQTPGKDRRHLERLHSEHLEPPPIFPATLLRRTPSAIDFDNRITLDFDVARKSTLKTFAPNRLFGKQVHPRILRQSTRNNDRLENIRFDENNGNVNFAADIRFSERFGEQESERVSERFDDILPQAQDRSNINSTNSYNNKNSNVGRVRKLNNTNSLRTADGKISKRGSSPPSRLVPTKVSMMVSISMVVMFAFFSFFSVGVFAVGEVAALRFAKKMEEVMDAQMEGRRMILMEYDLRS
jgi:hypothetical protein